MILTDRHLKVLAFTVACITDPVDRGRVFNKLTHYLRNDHNTRFLEALFKLTYENELVQCNRDRGEVNEAAKVVHS